jgi:DedD protein
LTRGYFDDEETEREEPQERGRDRGRNRGDAHGHDTELTLGTGALLGIVFGLVLLCGLCFWLGYAVGHRGSATAPATATQPASPTATPDQEPLQGNGSLPKPSADAQAPLPQGPPESDGTIPPADGGDTNPAATQPEPATDVPTTPPAKSPENAPAPPAPAQPPTQVKTALPGAGSGSHGGEPVAPSAPAAPVPASPVHPALPAEAGQFMVQVAAVSHAEDAGVLVGALRKRGYAASAQREPSDGLIHVRIGPFATHDEAYRMCARLLDDGYNAIVQP